MHWNVIDYNKFLNIVFMHLNKQNFIIILAAFSLLSSCVYHFDLDEISEVPKLTVYSYPGSGDTTVVRLSHSLPVYDKGMRMYGLKGRDIRLEVNDIAVPLLWTEDSLPGVPAKSYYVVQPYETSDRVRLTASVEGRLSQNETAFFVFAKKIGQVLTSLSQNLPVSLIFCILGNQVKISQR